MNLRKFRKAFWIALTILNLISMTVASYTGDDESFLLSTIMTAFCIFNLWIYEKIMKYHDKKD